MNFLFLFLFLCVIILHVNNVVLINVFHSTTDSYCGDSGVGFFNTRPWNLRKQEVSMSHHRLYPWFDVEGYIQTWTARAWTDCVRDQEEGQFVVCCDGPQCADFEWMDVALIHPHQPQAEHIAPAQDADSMPTAFHYRYGLTFSQQRSSKTGF